MAPPRPGHPANEKYHYHGYAPCLAEILGDSDDASAHSSILGWAMDGFPIYGPFGYTDATDVTSTIKRIETGYEMTGTDATEPSDWEFTGVGDLDQCNGRYGATAEFPDGIYYYVFNVDENLAIEFPGVPYCLGSAAASSDSCATTTPAPSVAPGDTTAVETAGPTSKPTAKPTAQPTAQPTAAVVITSDFTVSGMTLDVAEEPGNDAIYESAVASAAGVEESQVSVMFSEVTAGRRRLAVGDLLVTYLITLLGAETASAVKTTIEALTTSELDAFIATAASGDDAFDDVLTEEISATFISTGDDDDEFVINDAATPKSVALPALLFTLFVALFRL